MSQQTFYRVRARFTTNEVVAKRRGTRAAYASQPFAWLDQTTPRHGDRPFALAHLDHTELDIVLVSSLTGKPLGKPWATFLTDAYSRRILACYLTYDPPSYRSVMMALRICVQRHQRLPQECFVASYCLPEGVRQGVFEQGLNLFGHVEFSSKKAV